MPASGLSFSSATTAKQYDKPNHLHADHAHHNLLRHGSQTHGPTDQQKAKHGTNGGQAYDQQSSDQLSVTPRPRGRAIALSLSIKK